MSEVVDLHLKNGIRTKYDIYIGRRVRFHKIFNYDSMWANRSKTLEDYEAWVLERRIGNLPELKGKILGCWCINTKELEPIKCHGQILMKLVKEREQ